jgi:hypothetical protein
MKKILPTTILFLITTAAVAQPSRGTFLVDANFSFNADHSNTSSPFLTPALYSSTTTWNLNPAAGYFVLNRWCIGVSTPYQHETSKSQNSPDLHSHSFGLGPFVRYYQPLGKKFYGVLHGGYSFSSSTSQSFIYGGGYNNVFFTMTTPLRSVIWGVGFNYFVKDNIAIALMGNLTSDNYGKQPPGDSMTGYHYTTKLGMQIYFSRKKAQ